MHSFKVADEMPMRSGPYRVSYNFRVEFNHQINLLVEANILVPSNSQYTLPVILVKKAVGGERGYSLACDFRKLNSKLLADVNAIPNITETIDSLAVAKNFSTLDLTNEFF